MTELSLLQATKIVKAMDDAKGLQHPLPANEAEFLAKGQEILEKAQAAYKAGAKIPVVEEILAIAIEQSPPWNPLDNEPPVSNTETVSASTADDASSGNTVAGDTDTTHLQSDQEKEFPPKIPELPRDFSQVSDIELRSLHAVRHGLLTRVTFDLGLEQSDYESAQVIAERKYREATASSTAKTISDKRAAANVDGEVIEWRDKVSAHHGKVIVLRSLKEILEREISGLSREYTMRTGERTGTPQ